MQRRKPLLWKVILIVLSFSLSIEAFKVVKCVYMAPSSPMQEREGRGGKSRGEWPLLSWPATFRDNESIRIFFNYQVSPNITIQKGAHLSVGFLHQVQLCFYARVQWQLKV
jgi:hypothetical protein